MLNEVLRLTQGDLSGIAKKDKPISQDQEKGQTERNNEAFYKDYQKECSE